VDAGMGQVYHGGFCGGNRNVRIHAEARISKTRRRRSTNGDVINAGPWRSFGVHSRFERFSARISAQQHDEIHRLTLSPLQIPAL
jgi:hypothetical protein